MEARLSILTRPLRRLLANSAHRLNSNVNDNSGNRSHEVDEDEESSAMYEKQAFPMLVPNENTFKQEMKNAQRTKNPPYVLVEGQRLIADTLAAGGRMRTLLFTNRNLLEQLPFQPRARVMFVHARLLKKVSDVRTPSGLFAFMYRPDAEQMQQMNSESRLSLICDEVRDPTNMGVILRAAAGFGLRRVIVTKNSVNVWSPKVLRGGMSAHWRVPIYSDVAWSTVNDLLDDDAQVHAAEGIQAVSASSNSAIYHEVDFAAARQPQVLVVGGETGGLSASALSLCARSGGRRLRIPMCNGMESLNVAIASAVILSEMTRQLG